MGDHVEQAVDIVEFGMPVGRDRGLACRDAANAGNVGSHFFCRQNSALARLGALGELELEHFHLFMCRDPAQTFVRQPPLFVAHAILGRTDLEDDVASAFQMHVRQAALARIHPDAGLGRSA